MFNIPEILEMVVRIYLHDKVCIILTLTEDLEMLTKLQ